MIRPTPSLIALLRRHWDEGLTTAEIGERVGISKNSVIGFAHRNGFPPRPHPIKVNRELRQQVQELHENGASVEVIAKTVRRRPREIRYILFGRKPRPQAHYTTPILPALPSLAAPVECKTVATIREAKQVELRLPTSKRSCQFIESDSKPWKWCCRPALFGKSWCGQHYRVVFTAASQKEAA